MPAHSKPYTSVRIVYSVEVCSTYQAGSLEACFSVRKLPLASFQFHFVAHLLLLGCLLRQQMPRLLLLLRVAVLQHVLQLCLLKRQNAQASKQKGR